MIVFEIDLYIFKSTFMDKSGRTLCQTEIPFPVFLIQISIQLPLTIANLVQNTIPNSYLVT